MKKTIAATQLPGLPDMPKTLSGVHRWAKRKGVRYLDKNGKPVDCKYGAHFSVADLPIGTQKHIIQESVEAIISGEKQGVTKSSQPQLTDPDYQITTFEESPDFARRKAEKYLVIIKATEGMIGGELKEWLEKWNAENPDQKASYPMVLRMRKQYAEEGIAGLLGQWGHKKGSTKIEDEWFEVFKAAYLKESRPSLASAWLKALGAATYENPNLNTQNFPSQTTFFRLLKDRIPDDVVYQARYGHGAWYRKFASFIDRDYSNIGVGEVWVSDHAQIDVLAGEDGKHKAPWFTAWRDVKSGKMLGWNLHLEAPNSDHIFEAFFEAAVKHGLPKHVLIDNGKDYRCKDFAGGRAFLKKHKVIIDEAKTRPMLDLLGIDVHFALPYNAQTKPIERDFLKFKTWFSKCFPGYRGGDVVERPEGLQLKVKSGELMEFKELKEIFDDFVEEAFNNFPSNGKVLQGRTPNQLWAAEFREKREVRRDALKLFCMRSSEVVTIRRNGIHDSKYDVDYYAEWMNGYRGTKVYFRRAPDQMQEVWVFNAADNSYIDAAYLRGKVDFFADTDVKKAELQEQLAAKRRDQKRVKEELAKITKLEPRVELAYLQTGTNAKYNTVVTETANPVVHMVNCQADQAVIQKKQVEDREKCGLQGLTPKAKRPTPIFASRTDKELYEKSLNRRNVDE